MWDEIQDIGEVILVVFFCLFVIAAIAAIVPFLIYWFIEIVQWSWNYAQSSA